MNESIRNMKKGQKVRLLMDWYKRENITESTYGIKGDIFTVAYDQQSEFSIILRNPNNNKTFHWSLNYNPTWERVNTNKEFTNEEYESLLV